jgi:hypothetical protein
MPVIWEVRSNVLIIAGIGAYTVEQFHAALADVAVSPMVRAGMPVLLDARSSLGYFDPREVVDRGRRLAQLGFSRYALLARPDPFRERLLELLREGIVKGGREALVFTDAEAAWRWVTSGQHSE